MSMPVIPAIGRKSARIRSVLTGIYVLLCLGALTTVYPFLVMIGSSLTSDYDQNTYTILPAYLTSSNALVAKYSEDKYNADLLALNRAYGSHYATLQDVQLKADPAADALVPKWRRFFAAQPAAYKIVGFVGPRGQYVPSKLLTEYRLWLRQRFDGDIEKMSREYVEEDTNFLAVFPPYERPTQRFFVPGGTGGAKDRDWALFQAQLPVNWFQPVLCDPLYQSYLHDEAYPSGKIVDLNSSWGTSYTDYAQVTLPPTLPAQARQARDWSDFVHRKLPLRFIAWSPKATAMWQSYLADYKEPASALPVSGQLPTGATLQRYAAFVANADPKTMQVRSLENLWRSSLSNPNTPVPLAIDDRDFALTHQGALRAEFMRRNYEFAIDYLLLHGRGITNTVIYCGGAVLIAVIINPLCAYALSRFRLPYATNILLFLLATMAFPSEITMIPNFLLLKQLNLLNTFWALILPGAASGFSIFLLKGFFDSLPPELYEAGMLDGAGEMVLFSRITLPLSGPIFAVIALQAFAAAYGAFLFAMIVAQAQDHWTLMVWIYEFQALAAPQYVIMAALVIAALPTLIVFLFAQNVIMRGIILPSYK